ncbi:MAG TPA: TolC family protein [Armatimonadota bacterium]|jgi:OMF family outer membrane factor
MRFPIRAAAFALAVAAPLYAQTPATPAAAVPAAAADAAPAMTLDDAIQVALKNNELIALSDQAAKKARARVREVAAGALPKLNASAQYTKQKESVGELPFGPNDPETGKPTLVRVVFNPATSKTATATASQLLDVFGVVRRGRSIASISARVAELNKLRSRSEVIYQTRAAYYNVLRAQGAVDVATASVTDVEEQLRLAQANLAAGTAPQFDVTRAQVTLADRQQTLINTKDQLSLAGSALNNVLGRDVNAPVSLAAVVEAPNREVDITGQTEKALESRPEVIQADLGVKANREVVGLQRLGTYPQFALSGTYQHDFTAAGLSPSNAYWSYGVSVSLPLYEGGATRARVDQAQADERSAELTRTQLRRGVALEVRQSGLLVQEAADRFDVADKSVALAEEALRLARVRYENGVATQLEVTDAETQLSQARFNRNNTRYDYLTARAAFDASLMGRLSSGVQSSGGGS